MKFMEPEFCCRETVSEMLRQLIIGDKREGEAAECEKAFTLAFSIERRIPPESRQVPTLAETNDG
jgi:hypothetical protein